MDSKVSWVPLESNPEVLTKYIVQLGVPPFWQITDVLGLDDELLQMVPQPILALLLLFPINERYEKFSKSQMEELKDQGQKVSDQLYFMRQTISNACGTVGLIHSIANNTDKIQLESGALKDFLEQTKSASPLERGKKLEVSEAISSVHEESAQEGQTEPSHAPVDYHFVSLVHVDGSLYELDGRKEIPVNHGPTDTNTFLQDAAAVCKQYMARDPDELRFTVVALTKAS